MIFEWLIIYSPIFIALFTILVVAYMAHRESGIPRA